MREGGLREWEKQGEREGESTDINHKGMPLYLHDNTVHTEYGVCTNTMRSVAYERGRGREDRGRRDGGGSGGPQQVYREDR